MAVVGCSGLNTSCIGTSDLGQFWGQPVVAVREYFLTPIGGEGLSVLPLSSVPPLVWSDAVHSLAGGGLPGPRTMSMTFGGHVALEGMRKERCPQWARVIWPGGAPSGFSPYCARVVSHAGGTVRL